MISLSLLHITGSQQMEFHNLSQVTEQQEYVTCFADFTILYKAAKKFLSINEGLKTDLHKT